METAKLKKQVTMYDFRETLENMKGTAGHRAPDDMEHLQIALPYILLDAGDRLKQSMQANRKPITQDGKFVWRGVIPEYQNLITVSMLMDISALIDELIASEIINLKIDDK